MRGREIITWGCCIGVSSWNRPPLPCDAVWTAACATPFSLTWKDAQSEARKKTYTQQIIPKNTSPCVVDDNQIMPTPCMCMLCVCFQSTRDWLYTHHFNVVKDSRHLLNPFNHLLRVLSIFSLSRHLLIKRHLPAHSWVFHLKPRVKYVHYTPCKDIYKVICTSIFIFNL